jgi:hypothetical protein
MAVCASVHAQSFIAFTTPNPVSAGHSFNLTVAGMLRPTNGQPVATVTSGGPGVVNIALGRDCGFPTCPQSTFHTQVVSIPGLPAGAYMARIFQGASASGADPDIQATIAVAGPNYQGLWWNAPAGSQSGWGLSIDHQGDVIFAAWFTYDESGAGMWLVMPNGARTGDGTYAGDVYRTTGPAFDARPWDPSAVSVTAVGNATLTFLSDRSGTFAYTVDGKSGVNTIIREVFSSPVATCVATP